MLERRTFSKLGAGLVVGIVAVNMLVIIATMIVSLFMSVGSVQLDLLLDHPLAQLILIVSSDIVILLAVWLFARRLPKAPARHGNLSAGATWNLIFSVLCVGMVMADLMALVGDYVNNTFSGLFPAGQSYVPDILQVAENLPSLLVNMAMVCIVAPVFEELIFRKIIAERLRPFGDATAILVSGVAFGLFHQNFLQMFYATALGILFGYVYLRTGKVWVVMVLHGLFNLLGGILPSVLHLWGGGYARPIAAILTIVFWGLGLWRGLALRRTFSLDRAPFRFSVPINGRVIVGNVGAILLIVMCIGLSLLTAWLPAITALFS